MTVYKAFMKCVMRNQWVILGYAAVFIVITVFRLSSVSDVVGEHFQISRFSVLLMERGEKSEMKEAIKSYLETRGNLEISDLSESQAIDRVVSQNHADLMLVLDDETEKRLLAGAPPARVYYEPGNVSGVLANYELNKYFTYLDAYYKTHGTFDYRAILAAMEKQTSVEILPNESRNLTGDLFFRYYMVFFHYIFVSLVLLIIPPVMLQFSSGMVKERRLVSSLRPSDYVIQVSFAIVSTALFLIAVFVIFCLLLIGFRIDGSTFAVVLLNFLIFSASIIGFVLLVSSFRIGYHMISFVANLFSLGIAFSSGIFVPRELLPKSIVEISKFFPAYHSVQVTETEGMALETMLYHWGIQLLMAAIFVIAAVYVNRGRKRSAITSGKAYDGGMF